MSSPTTRPPTVPSRRYLDPDALARMGSLELVARRVVEGFLAGRHRSPYHGFSVEYLDHRAYSPGDEIRSLDWKLLARTDKYYIKLFQDETNLRAHVLLDCSRSMGFASGGLSKLAYAGYLAAALSYLMLHQNDAVGLVLFDSEVRQYLEPRARSTHFHRILDLLDQPTAGGDTDVGVVLHQVAARIRRRGLVILLSDLLDDVRSIVSGLQHFRHDGHEMIVFQILDGAELTLPHDRPVRFRDMEGPGHLVANPGAVRAAYLRRLNHFLETLRTACAEADVTYRLADTRQPYDAFLAAYLDKRSRMG
jgi:uncharacterized protein (DUF58 family)